ncbi:MAG: DNA replication/repair protein RecF [Cytophagaceae bacterium]|nr:DNA replication/repair protein RecF [Cytophagaceae bacterium]
MHLKKIRLINFKNYKETELAFSPQINAFTGLNGSGKTNLLDAIYYLSLTKSAFHTNDAMSISHHEDFFRLEAVFDKAEQEYNVETGFSNTQKKIFKVDKTSYEKIKDHIGKFPVVLITPFDTDVIREGSEERRKFFDNVFAQLDSEYLEHLLKYNHILKQRNSLLKKFKEENKTDEILLAAYDEPLIETAEKIYGRRKNFISDLQPLFENHYQSLAGKKEKVSLIYQSHLENKDFKSAYKASLPRDIFLERTSKGTHKDDYVFLINEMPLKNFGSQGQQKSFVIALKLAQFDLIHQVKKNKPILLLDDIFDKLDDERISQLLNMVANDKFGQLFITDARPERTKEFFKNIKAKISIFRIENGRIIDN